MVVDQVWQKTKTETDRMKTNRVLTVAAVAAVLTVTPKRANSCH